MSTKTAKQTTAKPITTVQTKSNESGGVTQPPAVTSNTVTATSTTTTNKSKNSGLVAKKRGMIAMPGGSNVPVDDYIQMTEEEKLDHLDEKMKGHDNVREGLLPSGAPKPDLVSNYRTLLETLDLDNHAARMQRQRKEGAIKMGTILEAVHEEEVLKRVRSKPSKLKDTVNAVRAVAKMGRLVSSKGGDLTQSGSFRVFKNSTEGSNRGAASHKETHEKTEAIERYKEKRSKGDEFRMSLNEAAADARPYLTRRKSYPPLISSLAVLRDAHTDIDKHVREYDDLRKIVEKMEPREQEKELEGKLKVLDLQITNQVGLIKGLREKLKAAEENLATARKKYNELQDTTRELAERTLGGRRDSNESSHSRSSPTPHAQARGLARNSALSESITEETGSDRRSPRKGGSFNDETAYGNSASFAPSTFAIQKKDKGARNSPSRLKRKDTDSPSLTRDRRRSSIFDTLRHSNSKINLLAPLLSKDKTLFAPQGSNTAIVFVDIQSGMYLHDVIPELMDEQVGLYMQVLTRNCGKYNGYMAARELDRVVFAFHSGMDAVHWCAHVQLELLEVPWSIELCENPDVPSELLRGGGPNDFLWRGLRVKMGIALGPQHYLDPLSQTIQYEGPALELAATLEQISCGGEILITSELYQSIAATMEHEDFITFQDWEELHFHSSRAMLVQAVPQRLADRLQHFQRDLASAERTVLDAVDDKLVLVPPPKDNIALLSLLVTNADTLYDEEIVPQPIRVKTLHMYADVLENLLKIHRGYISVSHRCDHVIAFQVLLDALKFSIAIQQALLAQRWPQELLAVSKFVNVRVRNDIIFSGLRVQVGIHHSLYKDYVNPLTGLTMYIGETWSTALAREAKCGEILISEPVLNTVAQHIETLDYPTFDFVMELAVPNTEHLEKAFQLFDSELQVRAAFVNRELRLLGEPADDEANIRAAMNRQIQTLNNKLQEKDTWIKHLEEQVVEKGNMIKDLRMSVLDTPYHTIKVRPEIAAVDKTVQPRNNCSIIAVSFAHSQSLLDNCPDEFPRALEVFENILETLLVSQHGYELRKLPSGISRIMSFYDSVQAADFWIKLCSECMEAEWPSKLDFTEEAGVVMASECVQGIHSAQDSIVWKGLRPICTMTIGSPNLYLNTCTRALEVVGDEINFVSQLLRQCQEGECIASKTFFDDISPKIGRVQNSKISEFGNNYYRITNESIKYRDKVMRATNTDPAVDTDLPVDARTALVLHLSMQHAPILTETSEFDADLKTYRNRIIECLDEFDGTIITAHQDDYCVAFLDTDKGAQFCTYIHTALMQLPWSPALLRIPEFKEVIRNRQAIFRGIRVSVGAHLVDDIRIVVDLFSGIDLWMHHDIPVPFLLSCKAHAGETLLTEAARHAVAQQHGTGRKSYVDTIGEIYFEDDDLPTYIYHALPALVKGRISVFVEEDKQLASPSTIAAMQKKQRCETRRRNAAAKVLGKDTAALPIMERADNPFEERTHSRNARLHSLAKEKMEEDLGVFRTALNTMALIENVSMMAEDKFLLGQENQEEPMHTHLVLHAVENLEICKDPIFQKKYAGDLLSGERGKIFGGARKKVTDDDIGGSQKMNRTNTSGSLDRIRNADEDAERLASINGSMRNLKRKSRQHQGIVPQDVILMHLEIEKFTNLILYHGIDNENAVTEWVEEYDNVVEMGTAKSAPQKLKEMSIQTQSFEADADVIDVETVKRSIVANLSMVLQRVIVERQRQNKESDEEMF